MQGYSRAGVPQSQAMADSVVRYLVTAHQVPIYRIYKTGLGKASAVEAKSEREADCERCPSDFAAQQFGDDGGDHIGAAGSEELELHDRSATRRKCSGYGAVSLAICWRTVYCLRLTHEI